MNDNTRNCRRPMAPVPDMTAEVRIIRAASRALEMQADLGPHRSLAELDGAAAGHQAAVCRLLDQAQKETDPRLKLAHVEAAGYHATRSLVCATRAEALRP